MGMAFTTGLAVLHRPVKKPLVCGIGGGPDGTGRGGGAAEAMRGIGGGGAAAPVGTDRPSAARMGAAAP